MDRMTPSIVSIEQIGVSVKIPDLFRTVFRPGYFTPPQRIANSGLAVTNRVMKFAVFDFFHQPYSAETHIFRTSIPSLTTPPRTTTLRP